MTKRIVHDVTKLTAELKEKGLISDYRIDLSGRHPAIVFEFDGQWRTLTFSMSPGSIFTNKYIKQNIFRLIKRTRAESADAAKHRSPEGVPQQAPDRTRQAAPSSQVSVRRRGRSHPSGWHG